LGYPKGAGGNIECVLAVLGHKLAPTINISFLKATNFSGPDLDTYNYFGGGLNYYFFKSGKGHYDHAGNTVQEIFTYYEKFLILRNTMLI
jgi:hypothetical protein